jgi:hypothetical protein
MTVLTVDTQGLFFDSMSLHSVDANVYGLTVTVATASGEPFWQHTITDQKNIHTFDIHEEALVHFPIKIVSTFSYNGEPAALFHVEYLFEVVNEFIIVEGRYTISGNRKPEMYFEKAENRALFAPYMSKIKYLIVEEIPPRPDDYIDPQLHAWMEPLAYDAFWGEHYQRQIVKQFIDVNAKTIYLCLDADEIPNRDVVAQFRDARLYESTFSRKIRLEMLYFSFNFHWTDTDTWTPPYAVNTVGYLAERDMVVARDVNSDRSVYIPSAGWHLSYFFSRPDVARKVESFAHRELDEAVYKGDGHIDRCLREGWDLFMRQKLRRVDVEGSAQVLPEGWKAFHEAILRMQQILPDGKGDGDAQEVRVS